MKFNIERNVFFKILQRVQGIIEKRSTMPILSNILIEADSGTVEISATDLEIFIKDSCNASVEKKGLATINARKIFEIVKELTCKDISVSTSKSGGISIKGGKAVFNILGLPVEEFPSFPDIEEGIITRISPDILKEMVDKTYFAASTDETRYNINGVFLEREDGKIRMVATDGHRLSVIEKNTEEIPSLTEGVILPRKGVTEFRRLLEEREGNFQLGFTKTYCIVKRDNTFIVIRLIDGEFPDYKQVVPTDNDKTIIVNRINLLSSLKRVSILSTERVKGVKFSFSKGKLELSSSSPDLGEAKEEMDIDYKGDELVIGFNARYIIDVLEAMDTEEVKLGLKGQLDPGLLQPVDIDGYTYVAMPMRI
jgi:DNA polymerase-3 subunit beta